MKSCDHILGTWGPAHLYGCLVCCGHMTDFQHFFAGFYVYFLFPAKNAHWGKLICCQMTAAKMLKNQIWSHGALT